MANSSVSLWRPVSRRTIPTAAGKDARTAADLAQQYARAVAYKVGVAAVSGAVRTGAAGAGAAAAAPCRQRGRKNAVWYTKYGGSSPSYRNYVIVPTEEANTCVAVFQMYGGGTTDYRPRLQLPPVRKTAAGSFPKCSGVTITCRSYRISWQDRTRAIPCVIFGLYYDSGLPPGPTCNTAIPGKR